MEIEAKKYEESLGQILETFRRLDAELTACRWLLSGLKEVHPQLDLDKGLEFVKTSPSFRKHIDERAALFGKLRESLAERAPNREVLRQLEE